MQFLCSFGVLLLSAAIAAAAPASPGLATADGDAVGPAAGAAADAAKPAAEAYVAALDADWNVTREVRVACPVETGCLVDLALDDPALAAVHVRFDTLQAGAGAVAVRSRVEDHQGRASAAEDEVLALDRVGFAAGHYEARMRASDGGGRTILMAVRVPGWSAPGLHPAADRT